MRISEGLSLKKKNLLLAAILLVCPVGVVCILSVVLFDRISKPYLLVVWLEAGKDPNVVEAVLKQLNLKHTLSSQIQLESHTEVICEIGLGEKQRKQLSKVKEIPGIISVSLVDCRKG